MKSVIFVVSLNEKFFILPGRAMSFAVILQNIFSTLLFIDKVLLSADLSAATT